MGYAALVMRFMMSNRKSGYFLELIYALDEDQQEILRLAVNRPDLLMGSACS